MRFCPAIVPALALLSGCAHSYLDQAGNRRVIGWVDLTLPPAIAAHDTGADWIRMRSFGLSISSSPIGNSLDLGYSNSLSLLCALLLLAGCANRTKDAVIITSTTFGIGVDPATSGAGVAYDRVEGFSSPIFASGVAPPVLASFESDGKKLFAPAVKQVFATGNAARKLATSMDTSSTNVTVRQARIQTVGFTQSTQGTDSAPSTATEASTGEPMFFGTGTVIGIKFGFSATAMDGFTFGFKRKEVSIIPRKNESNDLASVLASIEAGATSPSTPVPGDANANIRQFFATGDAADALAGDDRIGRLFRDKAQDSFVTFHEQQRDHNEAALVAMACILKVDDARLNAAWTDAEVQQLFTNEGAIDALKSADAQTARAKYATELFLVDHNDHELTARLREHKAYVCGLAAK